MSLASTTPSMIHRSPLPDIEIPDVALTEYVLRHASRLAEKPAVIDGSTGRYLTYGDLDRKVRSFAGGLLARGFTKGDVVALLAPNSPEFIVALLGTALAGCATTTINPGYTAREVRHQLIDADARLILTVPGCVDTAIAAAVGTRVTELVMIGDEEIEGTTPFPRLLGDPIDRQQPVDGADVVVLPYSSGTTGLSKGVMLTHRNTVANIAQAVAMDATGGEDDVVDAVLPFFHIYAMQVIVHPTLAVGGTLVLLPRFDLGQYLAMHQRYNVTVSFIVPPIALALTHHPMVDEYDLSSLRRVMSAAAPLSARQQEQLSSRLGVEVAQGYGMTELSPVSHAAPGVDARLRHGVGLKAGSVGVLAPNTEALIVDPATGEAVGPDMQGELWVRGPQVMAGYLNNPSATSATVDSDGWLHTGDLGSVDADGHLFIADRIKELIKYNGFQVPPAELEGLLLTHPDVTDAAVIGRPDDDAGEIPIAFVVLAHESSSTPDDVRSFVNGQVARYKHLDDVVAIEAIPKSPSGKILRRDLRNR